MYASDKEKQKIYLVTGIFINITVLAIFKYLNFFIDSADIFLGAFGFKLQTMKIILPSGISFFTFEVISYLMDIYRQNIKKETGFIDFALFMFFFPGLISGPIIRATDFLPQANQNITISKKIYIMECSYSL